MARAHVGLPVPEEGIDGDSVVHPLDEAHAVTEGGHAVVPDAQVEAAGVLVGTEEGIGQLKDLQGRGRELAAEVGQLKAAQGRELESRRTSRDWRMVICLDLKSWLEQTV
eukprot:1156723-Pelagomonas_calceolata.AAC.19